MREGFRQAMAWLHTWAGLLPCWILLLVFMGGTVSYYREEITFWMKPELHGVPASGNDAIQSARLARQLLEQRVPDAQRWTIDLPGPRTPAITTSWSLAPVKGEPVHLRRARFARQSAFIDPLSGAELARPRETRGGEFLYRLHYDLYYMPALWARWIVSACAMFMLVAIISGVITHRRIFKDFFTFRPKKGQRSWLDAHNALAVLPLPFHLMVTYTGLVTLMAMTMPTPARVMYDDGTPGFINEIFPADAPRRKPAGERAPLADLGPMLAQAALRWNQEAPGRIIVNLPGDENASVMLVRRSGGKLSSRSETMSFDGVSGAVLQAAPEPGAVASTFRALYGLHQAHFADSLLRALFFLCGLAGSAMVATGALLWAVKARERHARAHGKDAPPGFGLRLVEGLNIGAIAGLPIAFGVYFWGNRLLPAAMPERMATEAHWFFIAWACAMLLALLKPGKRMWRFQLCLGAVFLAGIPLLDLMTNPVPLVQRFTESAGAGALIGVNLVTLALGLLLACASWRLGQEPAPKKALAARTRVQDFAVPTTSNQIMKESTS